MAGVSSLAGLSLPLDAQPPPKGAEQIAKTLRDWESRHKRFQSVRYVVAGETEQKDLPAGSKLPSKRPVKHVLLLDLVQGRIRIETESTGVGYKFEKYVPRVTVSTYNGKTYQTNVDRVKSELHPKNPNVAITKGSMERIQIETDIWPVLFAHGLVPTENKPSRPDRLLAKHTADEFEYRGEVSHQGSHCIVLRTDPVASTPFLVDELDIDPGKESRD